MIVFGDNELKCSKCSDRKAKIAVRTLQMLQSLREETEGKFQMLLSLRKNGLTS